MTAHDGADPGRPGGEHSGRFGYFDGARLSVREDRGPHRLLRCASGMFEHLQRLSMDFYARTEMGDVMSRFSNDIGAVETGLAAGVRGACSR